jgi:hypothetical protein
VDHQSRQDGNLRGLKALVVVLGILVVLGSALVLGVIIQRIYAKPTASAPPYEAKGILVLPQAPHLLGPGERITGLSSADGEIAIAVSGPGGDRLLLLNPASGQLRTALSSMH